MPTPASTRVVDEIALAKCWLEWLADTRDGYVESLIKIPEAERRKDRGASFPSLEDIYLHLVDNNVWWLESVPQGRQKSHRSVEGPLSSQKIRRESARIAKIGRELAAALSTERLNESFVVNGTSGDGTPFEMRMNLRTIIWHMVEEELQHRGELNALFWQMDVDAPTRAWFSSSLAE
jgi:uncharacterized damage-inducible protein DinB